MKPYRNLSGDAGVVAYDYGPDWIRIQFENDGTYEYTSSSVGRTNLEALKRLADAGDGLTTSSIRLRRSEWVIHDVFFEKPLAAKGAAQWRAECTLDFSPGVLDCPPKCACWIAICCGNC